MGIFPSSSSISLSSLLVFAMFMREAHSTTFTIVNKCEYTIWPGILANAGEPPLSTTGFALQKGASKLLSAPEGWGGRFWARTSCSQAAGNTASSVNFSCLTGDCGSGDVECRGGGATPPATLAEFKLDGGGSGGLDFFDISLVDGYNLPVLVTPQGSRGGRNCSAAECVLDVNSECPSELRVTSEGVGSGKGNVIACKSACDAFGQPQYCCSGAYANPQTCKPSQYSEIFKSACPRAYSYAYDDGTSTLTCADADYVITFCLSSNTSQKSGSSQDQTATGTTPPATVPLINDTMVYEGAMDALSSSNASPSARGHTFRLVWAAALISVAVMARQHVLSFSSSS